MSRVELHVNIDHVATVRQARGSRYPDPTRAAFLCELAGADGITVHLREDRRHAQDADVERLRAVVETRLNLEMACSDAMLEVALRTQPDLVTLVPERREERTTEGGLDVAGRKAEVARIVKALADAGIPSSLFIDPEIAQVDASVQVGAAAVELHTGDYANASNARAPEVAHELERLAAASRHAGAQPGLHVAAGHGLTVRNVGTLLREAVEIVELNIGHALISDAIFVGLEGAVAAFRAAIDDGESRR